MKLNVIHRILVVLMCLLQIACSESNSEQLAQTKQVVETLNGIRTELAALRVELVGLREQQAKAQVQSPTVAVKRQRPSGGNVQISVELVDEPALGPADARVVVVEYTDFQCPYCARHHRQTFAELKRRYIDTGKLRYVVKDFPLGFHKEARNAAVAANCAGEQGKYWAMQDELFSKQRQLNAAIYATMASNLDLAPDSFKACMSNKQQFAEVEGDLIDAQQIGVRGTPQFVIGRMKDGKLVGGIKFSGAQPVSTFSAAIEKILAETS